jgi:hypothetical protein
MGKAFRPRKERVSLREVPPSKYQTAGREFISGMLRRPYQPYAGRRVAELTPLELRGQQILGEYADRDVAPLREVAQTELYRTLAGEYDPTVSPYYRATRRGIGRGLGRQKAAIRRRAQLGGGLYGTPTETAEALADVEATTRLGQILSGMAETERARRLATVPTALREAEAVEEAPLRTVQAIQRYGATPRDIEQAELQAAYEGYLREQQYPFMLSQLAQFLAGQEPTYMPEYQYGPSPFAEIAPLIGELGGAYIGRG